MKKVFRNAAEVAHMWASQSQAEGRCTNASFRMDEHVNHFLSYRTVVAKVIGDYVIIDRHNYSATTSSQYSDIKAAFRNMKKVLRVHGVDSSLDVSKASTQREVEDLLDKAAKARLKRDEYLAQAADIVEQYNTYVGLMKGLKKYRIKLDIENFSPEQRAAGLRAVAAVEKKRRDAAAAARKVALADSIKLWRARQFTSGLYDAPTMLRLNADRTEVETSRHARIPVADALKLWPIILRCKNGSRDFEPGMPLGSYRLTKILSSGDIVVGCHDIAFAEIEAIAQQLGLLEEVAA